MTLGIQRKLERIADEGCYLLCLIKAAGADVNDVVNIYDRAYKAGYISDDCYVKQPVLLLNMLGYDTIRTVEKSDDWDCYAPINIAVFKRNSYRHFVLWDNEHGTYWDPLGDSQTFRLGSIESWRVFR